MAHAPLVDDTDAMRTVLVAALAVMALAAGCSDDDGDDEGDSTSDTSVPDQPAATDPPPAVAFGFRVEGVVEGGNVPVEITCDGANDTPVVTIESVPAGVAQIVLIVDDPDAPTPDPFVHWLVYGIGPATTTIDDGDDALTYGVNDFGEARWLGPCPPPGDGLHAYQWKLFGLSSTLDLDPGLDGRAVEAAITDVVVAEALITSSYGRDG